MLSVNDDKTVEILFVFWEKLQRAQTTYSGLFDPTYSLFFNLSFMIPIIYVLLNFLKYIFSVFNIKEYFTYR